MTSTTIQPTTSLGGNTGLSLIVAPGDEPVFLDQWRYAAGPIEPTGMPVLRDISPQGQRWRLPSFVGASSELTTVSELAAVGWATTYFSLVGYLGTEERSLAGAPDQYATFVFQLEDSPYSRIGTEPYLATPSSERPANREQGESADVLASHDWLVTHPEEIERFAGNWVAVGPDGILACGPDLSALRGEMASKGISRPLYTWVQENRTDDELAWPGWF